MSPAVVIRALSSGTLYIENTVKSPSATCGSAAHAISFAICSALSSLPASTDCRNASSGARPLAVDGVQHAAALSPTSLRALTQSASIGRIRSRSPHASTSWTY